MWLLLSLLTTAPAADRCSGQWTVEWMRPLPWKPAMFTGSFALEREGSRCSASLGFSQSEATFEAQRVVVRRDRIEATFLNDDRPLQLRLFRQDDEVLGYAQWGQIDWSPISGHASSAALVDDSIEHSPWPVVAPAEVGLDPARMTELVQTADELHSHGLVILKDGQVVVSRAFGEGHGPLMSITKPLSSLAVSFLLAEGKWDSLDAPLGPLFDRWAEDDPRHRISLRHILGHSSGLHHERKATTLNAQPDRVAFAVDTRLVSPPGTAVSYNNRAFALLAGVVKRTTGEDIQQWLTPRLAEPLGLDLHWIRDTSGNPDTYGGAGLTTLDLAKLGQLMLDDGVWEGERVLPEGWVGLTTVAADASLSPNIGLGWFLLEKEAPVRGYYHTGWDGQYLLVLPDERIVVARQHLRWPERHRDAAANVHGWNGFIRQMIRALHDAG